MAVAAPCPYCDQDRDAWQRSTKTPPPAISGTAAAVLDGACGRLIFGLNPNDRHPPASIAKIVSAKGLMTAPISSNTNSIAHIGTSASQPMGEPPGAGLNGWGAKFQK